MRLLYQGACVMEWRLLEEHAPDMPSKRDMARAVARDPVSQAKFFHLMVTLFLRHVLGVDISGGASGGAGFPDGFASEFGRGVFGLVKAYFGPIETQGRGGLHVHMLVFVAHYMRSYWLDRLRRGYCDDEVQRSLLRWRAAVFEKVGSMQFDSVE